MVRLGFFLHLTVLFSHIVSAVRFTYPGTSGTTLTFLKPITWETNSTDPAIGRILLVNTAVTPTDVMVVANRVQLADKTFTTRREFILGLVGGGNYHFEFWNLEEPPKLLAVSYEFLVEGGRDAGLGTTSSGGASGSATGASSSTTMPTSTRTSGGTSTASITSIESTGTPSPTSAPNQSIRSVAGGFFTGALGLGALTLVVACLLG